MLFATSEFYNQVSEKLVSGHITAGRHSPESQDLDSNGPPERHN